MRRLTILALGLSGEGISGIKAFDGMANHEVFGKQVHSRAEEAGVSLMDTAKEVATESDLIFAAVPSGFTMDVCRGILDCLNQDKLYVDVSASTPKVKKEIWELIQGTGVLFADASMLGSLPKDKHKVPMMASGNGAKRYKEAADAYGVSEVVVDSLSTSLDGIPFRAHLDRLVTGAAIHCVRKGHELEGSMEMQEDEGQTPIMSRAARDKHTALEPYKFAERFMEKKPEGYQEIIRVMKENRK